MATRKVSREMEFFYNGEDSFEKMIEELNNRFSYQKVVFITSDKTMQDMIFEKRKLFKFFSSVKSNLNHIEQDVCCVVQMCGFDILKNRKVCFSQNISFVLCITSYIDISLFDDKIIFDNKEILSPMLGVFVLPETIKNQIDDFKFSLYLNMIEMCFYAIENKLNSLYFSVDNNQFDKIMQKIHNFFEKNNKKSQKLQYFLDFYFEMIIIKREMNCDLLNSFLSSEYEIDDLFYKSVLSEVLLNIYQTFIKTASPNIVSVMNSNGLICFENYLAFNDSFDEDKFWFVHSKFKYEVVNDIENLLNIIYNLKKLLQRTNIDAVYLLSKNANFDKLKSKLKAMALSLKENSLLKVIASFGFLDFD